MGMQQHVYVQDTYIAATNTPARFPPNLYITVSSLRHWVKHDSKLHEDKIHGKVLGYDRSGCKYRIKGWGLRQR
jgi:hypothetical protein